MPTLEEAEQALERGDFATARKIARPLASSDERARAILDRTRPDPVIVWLTVACVLFFVVVTVVTLSR